ncbi:MAG: hypothetical protein AAF493_09945 [Pseudomonadota bacterium]
MLRNLLIAWLLSSFAMAAHAASISVQVVSADALQFTFAGELMGPVSSVSPGILFIDTPGVQPNASFSSITGELLVGTRTIDNSFVGFDNAPYGSSVQLRSGLNGDPPFSVGVSVSGTATITYNASHGLTQSVFDGAGVPIFWGRNAANTAGTPQGFATTSPVPLPIAAWLFISAFGGLVAIRRWRAP